MPPAVPARAPGPKHRKSSRPAPRRVRRWTPVLATGATLAVVAAGASALTSSPAPASGRLVADSQSGWRHGGSHGWRDQWWRDGDGQPMPSPVGQPALASPPAPAPAPSPTPSPSPDPGASTPAPSGSAPATPPEVPGSWKLTFDDEFNGSSLNTALWSTGWFGSGITPPVNTYETECYDPNQVSVNGGSLNLTLIAKSESCGISDPQYASGLVSTAGKFTYSYGLLEARVYLPATSGGQIANWPAVWTDGQSWPADGEDDILEGLGGQACAHFHSAAEASGVGAGGGSGCSGGDYAAGWHTFAADWEPGSVTYYYDGRNIGSITSGVTSAPMYIILNYAAGSASAEVPDTMKVDYVRVWQHA
jgi:Glycosyl hydrolases family 16